MVFVDYHPMLLVLVPLGYLDHQLEHYRAPLMVLDSRPISLLKTKLVQLVPELLLGSPSVFLTPFKRAPKLLKEGM